MGRASLENKRSIIKKVSSAGKGFLASINQLVNRLRTQRCISAQLKDTHASRMTSESVEKEQFQKVPRNKMQRTFTFLLSTIIVGLLLIVATGETSHDYALEYQSQGYTSTGGGHYARRSPASRRSSPKVMHQMADAGGDFKTVGEEYEAHLEDSMNLLKEKDYGINSFMLVHTGEMHVSIKQENIPSVSKEIDSIVKDVGEGYYENKGHMNVGTDYERLVMTIRVRTDSFQKVIDGIRKVSDSVNYLSTRSKDVTDEFVDASARADALEAARTSIRAIMAKADNINEVLKIQQELNRLTEASESHRQRAQTLQKQAVSQCRAFCSKSQHQRF